MRYRRGMLKPAFRCNHTGGGGSSLSSRLTGPPLAASSPSPDSDRANEISFCE